LWKNTVFWFTCCRKYSRAARVGVELDLPSASYRLSIALSAW
jgi:hypothetical protein